MNTRRTLATTTALALGLALLAQTAGAQTTAEAFYLGEVIIGYTRDGTPIYAGENTTSLDSDDLARTGGAAALDTVLREQTSVFTQQDIGNPGVAVNIRGFEGSGRVSVQVDGVPQNFRLTGHAAQSAAYVDPNLLSTIDITRGAVVTAGGSGIAGSVDFRTISPEDVVTDGSGFGGLVRLSYGDNADAKSGMVALGYIGDRFDGLIALSRNTADNYEDGDNAEVANSWTDNGSGLVKLGFNIDETQRVSFSAMRYAADFYATSYTQDLTNTVYTLGYKLNPGDGVVNLDVNIYRGETETEWVAGTGSAVGRIMATTTTGINLTNVSEFELGAWTLVSVNGIDLSQDKLGGTKGGVNPTSGKTTRAALFTENVFTSGALELTFGLRATSYKVDGQASHGAVDKSYSSVDPKLTLAYRVSDWFQPYVTVSRATRSPTLQETMLGGTHPGGGIGMIANPELLPEQSTGYELGFNIDRQGLFAADDRLEGRINYYNMRVKDYVTASYPNNFTNLFGDTGIAFINLPGTAKTSGFEVELAYGFGAYDVALAYTRNMSDMPAQVAGLGAGQYLPDATVTFTVSGTFLEDRLTVGGQYSYVSGGAYTALYSATTSYTDTSYELVDLFGSYKVSDNFTVNARIENLFDKTYVPWLSLSENGPGRTAYLGGEIRF